MSVKMAWLDAYSSRVEKLICGGSGYLKRADAAMAEAYKRAIATTQDRQAFRQEAITALRERDRCTDEDCLMDWYSKRLQRLEATPSSPTLGKNEASPSATRQAGNGSFPALLWGGWVCTGWGSRSSTVVYFEDGTFVRRGEYQGGMVLFAGEYEFDHSNSQIIENERLNRFQNYPGIGTTAWGPAAKGNTWASSNHKVWVSILSVDAKGIIFAPQRSYNWNRTDVNEMRGKEAFRPYSCTSPSSTERAILRSERAAVPGLGR